jgi:N-acetylglucosaminyldiphosphoundecaprenol N-acetyl-beta-D-mannosaminyltransferase
MAPHQPLQILGSRVDSVGMEEAQQRIAQLLTERRFAQVITFGSEMAMLARRDAAYRDAVNAADLVVPDTVGVVIAARLLGQPVRERVAGIELIESVCAACAHNGTRIFLLGGAEGVAQQAGNALVQRHPGLQVAGTRDGYFSEAEDASVIEQIKSSGAQLVFVALGFPKQELWVRAHAAELGAVVCIGIGGSLDVISGRLQRAPAVMRTLGLEWLYRLVKEPQRLRRQLVLPQFAFLITGQALRERFGGTHS